MSMNHHQPTGGTMRVDDLDQAVIDQPTDALLSKTVLGFHSIACSPLVRFNSLTRVCSLPFGPRAWDESRFRHLDLVRSRNGTAAPRRSRQSGLESVLRLWVGRFPEAQQLQPESILVPL